ncbi:MAG: DUF3052 domain-containing protein [Chthoniobacterales bacterium]|jgi:hypothetical protein
MAGYSGTPLWKKLGYRDGVPSSVEGAPANYVQMLQLPSEISVTWAKQPAPGIGFVHLFTASKSELKKRLRVFRKTIDPSGAVWVSWPKKSSCVETDVTEDVIREVALPLGFVDIKVCAVDETWSGLKLVIRKELR